MGIMGSKKSRTGDNLALLKKKVIFLGLEGAGKTSLVQKIKYGQPVNVKPTVGFNLEAFKTTELDLMMFDIAGGARSMWGHYLEGADVVVYVVDATNSQGFEFQKELFRQINKEIKPRKCLFICVLNKCDLADALPTADFVNRSDISEYVDSDLVLIRTSTVTDEGIKKVTDTIRDYHCPQKQ